MSRQSEQPWRHAMHPETGEWQIETRSGDVVCTVCERRWEACGGTVRTRKTEQGGGYGVAVCTPNTGRSFADAALIAAAPDLLEVARQVIETRKAAGGMAVDDDALFEMARDAVARAETPA